MTENKQPESPTPQEPSMEDILASIRRILADDAPAEPDADKRIEAKPPVEKTQPPAVAEKALAERPPAEEPPAAAEPVAPPPKPVRKPEPPVVVKKAAPKPVVEPAAPLPALQPVAAVQEEVIDRDTKPAPIESAANSQPTEEIFELTQTMKKAAEHLLVSSPTGENATDVLAQLAKAILEQRDVALGAHEVTLEGMVRAMLRPLLKEWLDRNLPYLIERLVKREIDLMVNRAERLE